MVPLMARDEDGGCVAVMSARLSERIGGPYAPGGRHAIRKLPSNPPLRPLARRAEREISEQLGGKAGIERTGATVWRRG
jgi:hypothetical protein